MGSFPAPDSCCQVYPRQTPNVLLLERFTKHDLMDEKLAELTEEERENQETREKIFREIMGNDSRGRVRCYGTGVSKSVIFGTKKSSKTGYISVGGEIRVHNDLIESQQAILTAQESKIRELEANQEQMKVQAEFQRLLKDMIGTQDYRFSASPPHVRDAASSFR